VPEISDGVVTLRSTNENGWFTVTVDGAKVGRVRLLDVGDSVAELSWQINETFRQRGHATRAVRLLVAHALSTGYTRVEAFVDVGNLPALRVASRSGMRREGVIRSRRTLDGARHDYVLLARLASDPEPHTRAGFIGLVNSTLPRTRLIAHVVVRDEHGRLLLCETTYKADWELPGGVVEPFESPRDGAAREATEELGISLPIGPLLCVDWLPPWNGWDDAVELLFDGGVHDDATFLERLSLQPREIKQVEFCTLDVVKERCLPGTYKRLAAVLGAPYGEVLYLERGTAVEGI
jgi:8-oxo-dGTP pyrophosphatase MutT (NUDIX family)